MTTLSAFTRGALILAALATAAFSSNLDAPDQCGLQAQADCVSLPCVYGPEGGPEQPTRELTRLDSVTV
jgi:hypothetical protein